MSMKRIIINVFFCILLYQVANSQSLEKDGVLKFDFTADENSTKKFIEWIAKSNYSETHKKFIKFKEDKLDDWFLYSILKKNIYETFPDKGPVFRDLFCWFVMNNLGYDCRLVFQNNEALLFVKTKTRIDFSLELKIKDDNFFLLNRPFAITSNELIKSRYVLNETGDTFDFLIRKTTNLPIKASDTVFFMGFYDSAYRKNYFNLDICVNKAIRYLLEDYPNVDRNQIVNTPFSEQARECVISKLKSYLAGADTITMVKVIFMFVRDGFLDLDDMNEDSFRRRKRQTPEESLIYSYHDSEDKSILFFSLVKEILNLPLIELYYPKTDHVEVGVSLDRCGLKSDFVYNGRTYVVCNTEVVDDGLAFHYCAFGRSKQIQNQSYEVVARYDGEM